MRLQRSSVKTEVTLKATDFIAGYSRKVQYNDIIIWEYTVYIIAGSRQTLLPDKTLDINLI